MPEAVENCHGPGIKRETSQKLGLTFSKGFELPELLEVLSSLVLCFKIDQEHTGTFNL